MWRRFTAVLVAALAAALVAPPAPARADDDEVRLRVAGRFTAGESPGSVNLQVRRRDDGCVSVRAVLSIELAGATADQLVVAVQGEDRWLPVRVAQVSDGRFVTDPVTPPRPVLCEKRNSSATVRWKVAFLAGTPAGEVTFVGEAYTAQGELIDRTDEKRELRAGRSVVPTVAPAPAKTPEATPEPTQAAAAPAGASPVADVVVAAPARPDDGGFLGVGTVLTGVGLGLVGLGVVLLVALFRRSRRDQGGGTQGGGTQGGGAQSGWTPGGWTPGGWTPGGWTPSGGTPGGGDGPGGDPPPTMILPRVVP